MNQPGKTALVTGGSRGLGKEISLRLGKENYAVAVNYLRSREEAEEAAALCGNGSYAIQADTGNASEVDKMIQSIRERSGRLDAVINNAGITIEKLLLRHSEQDWDSVIRTNLTGCFHVLRASAPLLAKSGSGQVINIASYAGIKGAVGMAAYSASKAALLGLSLTAAQELAEYGIRVNAILPGFLLTGMASSSAALDRARETSIMKMTGSLNGVADFIMFLLRADNISGQIFNLDSRIV